MYYIIFSEENNLNHSDYKVDMPRGRPVNSQIRQNIIEILYYIEKGYGYQISKIYQEIFPKVTQRSIYYHLRKGVNTGEIEVQEIRQERGEYSWGSSVEKTYYSLGKEAMPKGSYRVKEFLQRIKD